MNYLFVCLFLVVRVFVSACGLFSGYCEQGLLSGCSAWASHWGGFFLCGAQALGCVGFSGGLSSCGSWALEHRLHSCGARAPAGGFFITESPGKPPNKLSGQPSVCVTEPLCCALETDTTW